MSYAKAKPLLCNNFRDVWVLFVARNVHKYVLGIYIKYSYLQGNFYFVHNNSQPPSLAIIAVLVQNVPPTQMRARMMSNYYIVMNLIVAGFAPVAVATSSSVLFDGPQSLGHALSLVAGVGIACATLLFVIAYHWMQRNEINI